MPKRQAEWQLFAVELQLPPRNTPLGASVPSSASPSSSPIACAHAASGPRPTSPRTGVSPTRLLRRHPRASGSPRAHPPSRALPPQRRLSRPHCPNSSHPPLYATTDAHRCTRTANRPQPGTRNLKPGTRSPNTQHRTPNTARTSPADAERTERSATAAPTPRPSPASRPSGPSSQRRPYGSREEGHYLGPELSDDSPIRWQVGHERAKPLVPRSLHIGEHGCLEEVTRPQE